MNRNQITLPAQDLDASIRFYKTLGLQLIVFADHGYARLECPDGGSTLSLHATDRDIVPGPVIYFETGDVDATVARLENAGITFHAPPADQRWLWREARTEDPSGHPVCIYHAGKNRRFPPWRLPPGP